MRKDRDTEPSTCGDEVIEILYERAYSIHARHPRGESVPAVHMVMRDKKTVSYRLMFRWLNQALQERRGDSSVGALSSILFDFEPAARKAFIAEFDTKAERSPIKVRGCRFHFGQAVVRNIDGCGLKTIKNDPIVAKWLKQILGLPLLPPKYVQSIWLSHLRQPPQVPGYEQAFTRFVKYFQKEWIRLPKRGNNMKKSDAHILLWNHFDNALCRTTNSAEGWHSGLKSAWPGVNPKLNSYIDWLIKAHDEHVTRIVQLDADAPLKRRDPRYVKLDENIARAKHRFQVREANEMANFSPDMTQIILQHLRYVSCLFGYAQWSDADTMDASLSEPTINAEQIDADLVVDDLPDEEETTTAIDPTRISLFGDSSSDRATPSSRSSQQPCPAAVHTFMSPYTSSSDDSTPADGSTAIATQPAVTIAFEDCIRCGSPTVDRCACCSRHLHENCAPVSGDPIFFFEQCGEELVEDALAVAKPRMGGARDAVIAMLEPFFISSE
uniref:MULE transposase domain-containing protein n=1 Tax=Plectus sambesii TaxID=2011161 RepID=A0A914WWP8_9BILA